MQRPNIGLQRTSACGLAAEAGPLFGRRNVIASALLGMVVVSCLLTAPALATGAQPKGLPIYSAQLLEETIAQWWYRDGDLSRELSDYWCEFAIRNPERFLTAFSHHEAVFNQWLAELPNLSFTDIGGCLDRECLRTMLIKRLDLAEPAKRQQALGSRLANRLREIHVSKVE